jgi:hypothetical protein
MVRLAAIALIDVIYYLYRPIRDIIGRCLPSSALLKRLPWLHVEFE